MSDLIPVFVRGVAPTDMSDFGIRFRPQECPPSYVVGDDGELWKSACYVCLYDDGRIVVFNETHLTPNELRTVYGIAERTFTGGTSMCRYEKWERVRKSSKRRQGFYRTHYYVHPDRDDPVLAHIASAALPYPAVHELRAEQGRSIEREIAS